MQIIDKTFAGVVALLMLVGGLPLLAFILMAFSPGAHASGGETGLGFMMIFACAIAAFSLIVGTVYFGYMLIRHKLLPKQWHRMVFAYLAIELAAPYFYLGL